MSNCLTERFQLMQMQKAVEARAGKKVKLRWNTAAEVRRSLARVNNMLVNGELTAKAANSVVVSANLILKAIELETENQNSTIKKECQND